MINSSQLDNVLIENSPQDQTLRKEPVDGVPWIAAIKVGAGTFQGYSDGVIFWWFEEGEVLEESLNSTLRTFSAPSTVFVMGSQLTSLLTSLRLYGDSLDQPETDLTQINRLTGLTENIISPDLWLLRSGTIDGSGVISSTGIIRN